MSEVLRACAAFFLYAVAAMFAENAVFSRALGVSRLVKLVDDSTVDTLVFGGLMCAVQLISAPLAKVANSLIQPFEFRSAIRPLVFILCSAVAFAVVLGLVLLVYHRSPITTLTILIGSVGIFLLGVELLVDRWLFHAWAPGWSLVVLVVCVGMVIPLIIIRRVPSLREEVRRRFHL